MGMYEDLIQYGIVDPPSEQELAQLPIDVYQQLAKTLEQSGLTSGQLERTEEEKERRNQEIQNILGYGQLPQYGSGAERRRKTAPPLTTQREGTEPIPATTALLRQQDTTGQTLRTEAANVNQYITEQFPQSLAKAGIDAKQIPQEVQAFQRLFSQKQIENQQSETRKTQVEVLQDALQEYQDLLNGNIPIISEEELDPNMQSLSSTPFVNAYSQQIKPGSIPNYTPAQLEYLKDLNKQKVDKYVERNYSEKIRSAPRMYYVTIDGKKRTITQPVLDHITSSPTAAIIYSPEIDDSIRKQVDDTYFGLTPIKINNQDYGVKTHHAKRMTKVEAIDKLGAGQWFQDPEQKKRVLENLDKFKEEGFFESKTGLGGTAESDFGYYTRLAFSPLNAFAAVAQKAGEREVSNLMGLAFEGASYVGLTGDLPEGESYFDQDMGTRQRMKEREDQASLYTEPVTLAGVEFEPDSLLGEMVDAVARNRGHLDFNTAVADGLNIDGALKLGMQAGGLSADFLSPDMAIFAGAMKGGKNAISMFNAQKAVHGADNWYATKKALQQFDRTFTSEVVNDFNFIGLTQDLVSKGTKKKLDTIAMGDVRLYMSDDMARNLEARNILESSLDPITDLERAGLEDTLYGQTFKEVGTVNQADEIFTANIRKNPKASDMYDEYVEMQKILKEAENYGLDDAIRFARERKVKTNYARLERIHKQASKMPDVGDEFQKIRNTQRVLSTVYGRGIFFETAPKIAGLDNIVAISRNTFGTKEARVDLLSTASRTKLAKSIQDVRNLPASRQIKPAEFASYKLYGDDVVAQQGRVELSYDLTNLDSESKELLYQNIDELDGTNTYKQYLREQVDNNRFFESDINSLVMKNRDDVALGRRDIFTTEEINALPLRQQKLLLEPQGSQARLDFKDGLFAQAIDKLGEGVNFFSQKALGRKVLNKTQEPLSTRVNTFEQTRMIEEVQKEMGVLDTQFNRDFKELTGNSVGVRAKYVNDPEVKLTKSEALGALIVGQKQMGAGKVVQQQELENTLTWMLNRCFYESKERLVTNGAVDDISGISTVLNAKIFTPQASEIIDSELAEIASKSIGNPRLMWQEFQAYVDDLDQLLEFDPYKELINPETGEMSRVRLVTPDLQYHKLKTVSNVELESIMEELTLGAYFHAEGIRINNRYLTQVVDKELTQLNVDNILEGVDIDQKMWENTVKHTASVVWRNDKPYASMLTEVQRVVQDTFFERQLRNLSEEYPDIEVMDLHKAIEKDFKKELKTVRDSFVEEYKAVVKDINANVVQEYKDVRQAAKDTFDEAIKELQRRQKLGEKQLSERIRKQAKDAIDKVGFRSAQATKIRASRDATIKRMRKDSSNEYLKRKKKLQEQKKKTADDAIENIRTRTKDEKANLRQQIDELVTGSFENFQQNMAGKNVKEALDWYTRNYDNADKQLSEILRKLDDATMSPTDIDKTARASIDYAEVVLANQNIRIDPSASLDEINEQLTKMFGADNGDFAKVMLGDQYESIRNTYVQQGITKVQENIKELIRTEPNLLGGVKKIMGMSSNIFYFAILGVRSRFHGMNFLTAPLITYQTLGRFTNPTSGINVVKDGGRVGAKNADAVAVRSPDGLTFTNRQIYEIIEKTGVKSEYNFIKQALNDGSMMRYLKNFERPGVGFKGGVKKFLQGTLTITDNINRLGVQSDMAWRASVFIDAIKGGSSVEEASGMARRSLFDYNDLTDRERKVATSVFVFYNFQRQNIVSMTKSLFDPKQLKRLARILTLKRDVNAVFQDLNGGKRYPYEMYMPEYAQTRIVFDRQENFNRQTFLKTSPAIPVLDAVMFATDIAGKGAIQTGSERLQQLLRPGLKYVLSTKQDKYKSRTVDTETINSLGAYYDSPQNIADALSLQLGSRVDPKFVGHTAVGNVNGYIYPLNEAQQKEFSKFRDSLSILGMTTAINDYVRLLSPEGSTYEVLTPTERVLAATGLLTPMRQKRIVDQQIMNLQRIRSDLRKQENIDASLSKGDILSGVKRQEPPLDEGEENGEDR